MEEQGRFNQEFGHYLHKVVFLIDRTADSSLQKQVGISLSQFLVLLSADRQSSLHLSQQAIANHLGINKAAVSRHIDSLEKKGLLIRTRHNSSKRINNLAITPEGKEVLRQAQKVMLATMSSHYSADGLHNAQIVLSTLKAIHNSLITNS